jgi:SsrA-binding protein
VAKETGRRLIASNKKARHAYAILRTYEAGLVLAGTEVKSLREGRASLVDAFAQEHEGEIMLYGLHIAEYGYGSWTNHAPRRTRKLLLHRIEIERILGQLRDGNGLTLVPLSMYFANGWAKVSVCRPVRNHLIKTERAKPIHTFREPAASRRLPRAARKTASPSLP